MREYETIRSESERGTKRQFESDLTVLDKIKAEIEKQEKWLLQAAYTTYNVDIAFDAIKSAVAESEVKGESNND